MTSSSTPRSARRLDIAGLQVPQCHRHPQVAPVAATLGAHSAKECDAFGRFPHSVEVEPVPAVSPRRHPTQGGIAVAPADDRDAVAAERVSD